MKLSLNYNEILYGVGENAGLASTQGAPNVPALQLIGAVINGFLGVLGVVFLGYAIYAGFIWMTAQGNEEKIQKAIGIIKTAIIGLIVMLAAYAIADFVIEQAGGATGATSTTAPASQ